MNKRSTPDIPDENRIEELLGKIQPVPSEGFHRKMKEAAWRVNQRRIAKSLRHKVSFAVVTLVILSALFLTPQGRAWAQEIAQFFRRVSSTTILLSEEEKEGMFVTPEQHELPLVKVFPSTLSPELSAIPECHSSGIAQSYECQIAYAESKLGLDLKEFRVQPEDWELESLNFDPSSKTAFMSYRIDISYGSYSQLMFTQGVGDRPAGSNHPLNAAPADRVEVVQIGPHHGEYVKGEFGISNDDTKLLWMDSDTRQRLAWSDGTRWYLIELFANTPGGKSIGRDPLIELAAGLVDKPVKTMESLNPDFLYSISDAEKLSGLDLKAPTLLPLGVEFSSAQVLPNSQKVILRYGDDELVIHVWKAPPKDFKDPAPDSNLDYEIVQVNGRNAFYSFTGGNTGFVWWSEGDLNYQLYYYQYFSPDGGVLNKEKMIAIAESMSDINVIRGNTFKPYEYVSIYEQALGLDVKEFQTTPVGWSFSNVYAYVRPACITLSYTAEKEIGWLSLQQCNTNMDNYFGQYAIPRSAIEDVQIGNSKGQYIMGNLEANDSGKLVWNPDLPFRTLRWQEDGRWLQLRLSGDSVLVYDKDDLIAYAESLR